MVQFELIFPGEKEPRPDTAQNTQAEVYREPPDEIYRPASSTEVWIIGSIVMGVGLSRYAVYKNGNRNHAYEQRILPIQHNS